MATDDYLRWCASINSGVESKTWTAELEDGRTIHICHQPMPDGGWVATHEDITELKANRSVANERISLQALIDWVPDYLWVKDKESRFVVVNKALAADSGRARRGADRPRRSALRPVARRKRAGSGEAIDNAKRVRCDYGSWLRTPRA